MPERTLTVRIIGDDRSLQQAFKRPRRPGRNSKSRRRGSARPRLERSSPAAAAAISVQKAFQFAGQSVDEASAVNEEVAKSEQVFGDSSNEVIAWSDTMATRSASRNERRSRRPAYSGTCSRSSGSGRRKPRKCRARLVELAADMASFNNASPEDVLLAIRSGLVGEAEPLRRYGVLLSEARVQQVALAETGKKTATSLTNQEKAAARYTIILQDTVKAQGDVARTSGSLANQQRELEAQWRNLEARLGAALIPQLTDFVTSLNDAVAAREYPRRLARQARRGSRKSRLPVLG